MRLIILAAACGLLLASCGKKPAPKPAAPQKPQAAADKGAPSPDEIAQTMMKQPEKASRQMLELALQQIVEAFKATNGRPPKSIKELNQSGFKAPQPPEGMKFEMDPKTGYIHVLKK